jgi:nickel-dependent lactate racemase
MLYFEQGSPEASLSSSELRHGLETALASFGTIRKMVIVPPDITRIHSRAGELCRFAYASNPGSVSAILPALGTHRAMSPDELTAMFGDIPQRLFIPHHWRTDCTSLGEVPADFVAEVSDGAVEYPIPVAINKLLFDGSLDCILSLSQVVPHEVAGMAGSSKNIVIGLGGAENIHKSHFLGAVFGMERIMGRAGTPVRKLLDHVVETYLRALPIVHAITVIGQDRNGLLVTRGLFIGEDEECFSRASELSQQVNIHLLDERPSRVVAYLDPLEFKSTWLGNKAIYRSRMAIADGGELIVLAPGVEGFGEDLEIDRLIRRFGYRGTPATLQAVEDDESLRSNLSAAAHLIHGSSEGRFSITYCAGGLEREEIEAVGFGYAPLEEMLKRYDPAQLSEGTNRFDNGEEFFFIAKPGTGLWAHRRLFDGS